MHIPRAFPRSTESEIVSEPRHLCFYKSPMWLWYFPKYHDISTSFTLWAHRCIIPLLALPLPFWFQCLVHSYSRPFALSTPSTSPELCVWLPHYRSLIRWSGVIPIVAASFLIMLVSWTTNWVAKNNNHFLPQSSWIQHGCSHFETLGRILLFVFLDFGIGQKSLVASSLWQHHFSFCLCHWLGLHSYVFTRSL